MSHRLVPSHRCLAAYVAIASMSLTACSGPDADAAGPSRPTNSVAEPTRPATSAVTTGAPRTSAPSPRAAPPPQTTQVATVGSSALRPPTTLQHEADPARLVIDAINVDVALGPLAVGRTGVLEAPADANDVGWWRSRRRAGPTVIVGHVDSRTGPAVFFRLKHLTKGDQIVVQFDGVAGATMREFTVRDLETVRKSNFPSARVYRGSPDDLRLVTCGGSFDRRTGHYVDNVIVYAASSPEAGESPAPPGGRHAFR